MGWPGPMTYRQECAWIAWLRPESSAPVESLPQGPEREAREAEAKARREEELLKKGWVKGPPIKRSEIKF